jgi:hypothetical protein
MTTKREELFDGLIRLATVPVLLVAPVGAPSGGGTLLLVFVLFLVFANTLAGVSRVLESLFGEDGLVCDLGRASAVAALRGDRAVGVRVRVTKPSRALRDRGAVGRVRGVRLLKRV